MKLSPREVDELLLRNAGFLAQKPLACGLRLNYTEAVALIASQILAIVREGEKTGRIDGHGYNFWEELPTYRVEIRRQVLLAVPHPLDNVQVIDYYAKKNVLAQLHAEKPPKEVSAEVQKALS